AARPRRRPAPSRRPRAAIPPPAKGYVSRPPHRVALSYEFRRAAAHSRRAGGARRRALRDSLARGLGAFAPLADRLHGADSGSHQPRGRRAAGGGAVRASTPQPPPPLALPRSAGVG